MFQKHLPARRARAASFRWKCFISGARANSGPAGSTLIAFFARRMHPPAGDPGELAGGCRSAPWTSNKAEMAPVDRRQAGDAGDKRCRRTGWRGKMPFRETDDGRWSSYGYLHSCHSAGRGAAIRMATGRAGAKKFWLAALRLTGLTGWMSGAASATGSSASRGAPACMPLALTALIWLAHYQQYGGAVPTDAGARLRGSQSVTGESALCPDPAPACWRGRRRRVWRRPGYLMMFTDPAQFNIIPMDGLTAENIARLRAAGSIRHL